MDDDKHLKEEPTLRGFFHAPNGTPGCILKKKKMGRPRNTKVTMSIDKVPTILIYVV